MSATMSAVCAVCGEQKEKNQFAKSQWHKRTKGVQWPKCKLCKVNMLKANKAPKNDTSSGSSGMDVSSVVANAKKEQERAKFLEKLNEDGTDDVRITGECAAVDYVQRVCKQAVRRQKTGYPKIRGQCFEIARKWSLDKTERDFITAFVRHARIDQDVALAEFRAQFAGPVAAATAGASESKIEGASAAVAASASRSAAGAKGSARGVYNVSKALRRIEQYAIYCHENFELFNTLPTEYEIKHAVEVGGGSFFNILYNPKERNPLVMVMDAPTKKEVERLINAPAKVKRNLVKNSFLMQHRLMYMPEAQVPGLVFLTDYARLSFRAMTKLQKVMPADLERANKGMLQGVFPARMTKLCMLNEPFWMRWIMSFVKPFISKKVKSRLHFLGSDKQAVFDQVLPAHCLHKDQGGTLDKLDNFLEHEQFTYCKACPLSGWPCSPLYDSSS